MLSGLSTEKVEAIDKMGFGLMNKIFLGFEKPFWDADKGGIQIIKEKNSIALNNGNRNEAEEEITAVFQVLYFY